MQYIKAPFNFVPVSKEVFYPGWADQISHDVPFSDGLSGQMVLNLRAETPIFIRDGNNKVEFCNHEGKYFIPATSIKGMIKNVLEIMSFGKLAVDERLKFATREWEKEKNYIYNLKNPGEQIKIRCGWLKKIDGQIKIIDCGFPHRINHKRIDEYLKLRILETNFRNNSSIDLNESIKINELNYDPKTACFKYALLGANVKKLKGIYFSKDEVYANEFQKKRVKVSSIEPDLKGTIVFTGQPNKWNSDREHDKGKFYEFVFPEIADNDRLKLNPISAKEFEKFEYLHRNSDDWNFWKAYLQKPEGIPVFFRNNGNNISDFGLAFLYKLPFKYSAKELNDLFQNIQNPSSPDLAECIFGNVLNDEESQKALKGRVQFGHAKAINTPVAFDNIVKTTLGSPKPSYFPIYIKQTNINADGVKKYITYHDKGASLSGWKRYPIRNSANPQPTDNVELDTEFLPLKSGAKFQSKINFHNLRPVELGALISAITFHGNEDKLFHSLGMAKSQGYGKVKVSYSIVSDELQEPSYYMAQFEKQMNSFLKEEWIHTAQLNELTTMACDKYTLLKNIELRYMNMSTDPASNEFALAKHFNEYLKQFTDLTRNYFNLQSISKPFEQKEQIEKEEQRVQHLNQFNSLLDEAELREASEEYNIVLEKLALAEQILPLSIKGLEMRKRVVIKKEFVDLKTKADILFNIKEYHFAKAKYIEAQNIVNNHDILRTEISICQKLIAEQTGIDNQINKEGDFDTNIKRIDQYKSKRQAEFFDQNDQAVLIRYLPRWIEMKNKNRGKWVEPFTESSYWKKIASWVGSDLAQKWYNDLIIKG